MAFLAPLAHASISYHFGFVLAATNVIAMLIVRNFLYESVSLSLENVDAMYAVPELNARDSKKWCPPGYINRKQRSGGVLEPAVELDDLARFSTAVAAQETLAGEHIEKTLSGDTVVCIRTREETYEHIEDRAS